MKRLAYLLLGSLSVVLGTAGVFLPLLPTVPLMIFAAFCFARSSPELERRIVEHPALKPHVLAWRQRRAISRKGKTTALVSFGVSAVLGFLMLSFPASLIPVLAGVIGGSWILGRPSAELNEDG